MMNMFQIAKVNARLSANDTYGYTRWSRDSETRFPFRKQDNLTEPDEIDILQEECHD